MEITIKGEPKEIATLLGTRSNSYDSSIERTPIIKFKGDLKGLAEILTPYLNDGYSKL